MLFLEFISDRHPNSKFDHTFANDYISAVIYRNGKSYTSFERAHNKLSKKIFCPLEAYNTSLKTYKIHFLIIHASIQI